MSKFKEIIWAIIIIIAAGISFGISLAGSVKFKQ